MLNFVFFPVLHQRLSVGGVGCQMAENLLLPAASVPKRLTAARWTVILLFLIGLLTLQILHQFQSFILHTEFVEYKDFHFCLFVLQTVLPKQWRVIEDKRLVFLLARFSSLATDCNLLETLFKIAAKPAGRRLVQLKELQTDVKRELPV